MEGETGEKWKRREEGITGNRKGENGEKVIERDRKQKKRDQWPTRGKR